VGSNPAGAKMSPVNDVLGRGLCDETVTRPEEFYRLRSVVVCDLETSKMRRTCLALGRSVTGKKEFKIKSTIFSFLISGSIYDGYSQSNVFNIIFQTEKIFGCTVLNVTGNYKKLLNKEGHGFYCFYCSPNID
jgi:hypothetical protein